MQIGQQRRRIQMLLLLLHQLLFDFELHGSLVSIGKFPLLVSRSLVLEPHFDDVLGQNELLRQLFGLFGIRIRILLKVDVKHLLLMVGECGASTLLVIRRRRLHLVLFVAMLIRDVCGIEAARDSRIVLITARTVHNVVDAVKVYSWLSSNE